MIENTMTENTGDGGGRRGSRWRIAAWAAAVLILLLPLTAMRFTDEVNWTVGDFVFAGILLFGTLGAYELAVKKRGDAAYRAAVGVALAAAFLLVWLTGAVGIIGSEDNPANLVYGGVLAIGITGALIARFEPRGMARAMFAAALAQVLVPAVALVTGWGITGPVWWWDTLGLTGFFVALWVGSAWLFREAAAREQPPAGAAPVGEPSVS